MELLDIDTQLWMLLDAAIAVVLGGIIGFEREKEDKPAGLRTNMIIAGSAAVIMMVGEYIVEGTFINVDSAAAGIDPTRILHAVIVGVSFIGAGTVLKSADDMKIRYLTTAATILMSASVGMSVAMHLYLLALGITILTVIINTLVARLYD